MSSRQPEDAGSWRLLGSRPPRCPFGAHRRAAWLDESARRLSHSELAVASVLVGEGHRVTALDEQPGRGRVADLEVCGQSVEVKTWLAPEARGGRPPTSRSVYNKLCAARGQGATAMLWARGSGLSVLDASRGVDEWIAVGQFGDIAAVRILGDGYDLAWGVRTIALRPDRAVDGPSSPDGPEAPPARTARWRPARARQPPRPRRPDIEVGIDGP